MSDDPVARTRASYDAVAEDFARAYADWDRADFVRAFVALLPPSPLVVEVGSGPGRDAATLSEAGCQVAALDLSWGMLQQNRTARRVQADMRALPIRDGVADAVWCQAAILHLPKADAPVALARMRRCLRDGGLLMISLQEGSGEQFETGYGGRATRFFARYTEEEFRAMVAPRGFDVVEFTREIGTPPAAGVTPRTWLTFVCLARG